MSDAPNTNEIKIVIQGGQCLSEIPEGVSPKEWQDMDVGWTKWGIQVWCNRHNCNVVHMDFKGTKHPANTTRRDPKPNLGLVH